MASETPSWFNATVSKTYVWHVSRAGVTGPFAAVPRRSTTANEYTDGDTCLSRGLLSTWTDRSEGRKTLRRSDVPTVEAVGHSSLRQESELPNMNKPSRSLSLRIRSSSDVASPPPELTSSIFSSQINWSWKSPAMPNIPVLDASTDRSVGYLAILLKKNPWCHPMGLCATFNEENLLHTGAGLKSPAGKGCDSSRIRGRVLSSET
mmetsp:Transcript_42002/g.101012  ORF Transcript_42002/g.101012 Transcript_42002/m.101012 type:complete len:206 (+) Transcript_42002:692-1309(+)